MPFINTDGLSFLGPGSEWFWTAFQGIVIAASLLGLLRQLRLQAAQQTREEVAAFQDRWRSERMLRHRLVLAVGQRDGTPANEFPRNAAATVGNFWEEMGTFTRRKYIDKAVMAPMLGGEACSSWQSMQPWIQFIREVIAADIFEDWEWLVAEMIRIDPQLGDPSPPTMAVGRVEILEDAIATEVELRH